MHLADREEFRVQLEKLCAAFNVPCTDAREEAYFSAFSHLSIIAFAKIVDAALSENGCEKFTVNALWEVHKKARASMTIVQQQKPNDDPDHLAYFANRLLWMHVSHRGGLGSTGTFVPAYGMVGCQASSELERCLHFKRQIVGDFCGFIRDGDTDATPAAFIRWWLAGLTKISDVLPRTKHALERLAEEPDSQVPFAAAMARDLPLPKSAPQLHLV